MAYRDTRLAALLHPLLGQGPGQGMPHAAGHVADLHRRLFLKRAAALGVSATLASGFWAHSVEAATPRRGGTYRVGIHDANTTDSFDPATPFGIYMTQLNHAFRSYLVEINADNSIGPDLAASWEATPDAMTWTFTLRRDVLFHDGKPLSGEDVRASLAYHLGEGNPSAAASHLADVEAITAEGDRVVIRCRRPFADLPYFLADKQLVIGPSDGQGSVDWQGGNGTGPYRITRHEPGITTELTRNETFFKPDRAWFDGVQMIAMNDGNARIAAIRSGAVDAISEFDLRFAPQLSAAPDIVIDETPSGAHACLAMDCSVAPFDNPDVRLALKYAIDRDAMIDKILRGHGTRGNDQPIGPSMPFHTDTGARAYDPDKARELLRKAGYDGLKVTLSAADIAFVGAVDMAVLFRDMCQPAGIEVEVLREADDAYWSNVWMKRPFFVSQWGGRPTPDAMFSLVYAGDAQWNETRWRNESFDTLLDEAKGELDEVRRRALYAQMQQICSDDGGAIIPFFRNRLHARRSNLQHSGTLSGAWELDGGRSFERWWFADQA